MSKYFAISVWRECPLDIPLGFSLSPSHRKVSRTDPQLDGVAADSETSPHPRVMLVLQAITLLVLIKVSSPSADEDVQIACTGQRVDLTFRKCVHEDDPFTLSRGLDTIVCTESGCRDKTYSREYNSSGCLTVVIANPTFEHDSTHHLEYSRKLSALVVRLRVRNCASASAHGQKGHQRWESPPDIDILPADEFMQVSAGVISTGYYSEHYGLIVTMVTAAVGVIMGWV